MLRILDFLVVNEEFDYSMADIARFSKVGYATLKLLWPKMEKNKIIIYTRTVGKAKMYKLNAVNPIIKNFHEFYWKITREEVRKEVVMPMSIARTR